mmetsp:Transcript_47952/g.114145  ORF Transcript_47952/g.114145 Transcript_47952/m.114145 type:complete len:672 (-) Transcript_47952:767-2782(-)
MGHRDGRPGVGRVRELGVRGRLRLLALQLRDAPLQGGDGGGRFDGPALGQLCAPLQLRKALSHHRCVRAHRNVRNAPALDHAGLVPRDGERGIQGLELRLQEGHPPLQLFVLRLVPGIHVPNILRISVIQSHRGRGRVPRRCPHRRVRDSRVHQRIMQIVLRGRDVERVVAVARSRGEREPPPQLLILLLERRHLALELHLVDALPGVVFDPERLVLRVQRPHHLVGLGLLLLERLDGREGHIVLSAHVLELLLQIVVPLLQRPPQLLLGSHLAEEFVLGPEARLELAAQRAHRVLSRREMHHKLVRLRLVFGGGLDLLVVVQRLQRLHLVLALGLEALEGLLLLAQLVRLHDQLLLEAVQVRKVAALLLDRVLSVVQRTLDHGHDLLVSLLLHNLLRLDLSFVVLAALQLRRQPLNLNPGLVEIDEGALELRFEVPAELVLRRDLRRQHRDRPAHLALLLVTHHRELLYLQLPSLSLRVDFRGEALDFGLEFCDARDHLRGARVLVPPHLIDVAGCLQEVVRQDRVILPEPVASRAQALDPVMRVAIHDLGSSLSGSARVQLAARIVRLAANLLGEEVARLLGTVRDEAEVHDHPPALVQAHDLDPSRLHLECASQVLLEGVLKCGARVGLFGDAVEILVECQRYRRHLVAGAERELFAEEQHRRVALRD